MLRLIALCALFSFVYSQTTSVSTCTHNGGDLPINVYVVGCTTPPCLLPQGQDVVINVVFRAPRTTRTMRTLATAFLTLIPVPIDYDLGPGAVTCNFLTNTYCPVLQNEVVQYTLRMYISQIFPSDLPVTVEFRVVDGNNDILWCIRLPVMIENSGGYFKRTNQTLN